MQLVKVNLKKLKQAKYNPRKKLKPSDKEYQQLKKSIENLGYSEPIIVNKDYTVIGGHQRLNVLKDLGYTEIDVIQLDLSKDKEKALNLALNKITGKWDDDLLDELLSDLSDVGFDLEITGFDNLDLDFDSFDEEEEETKQKTDETFEDEEDLDVTDDEEFEEEKENDRMKTIYNYKLDIYDADNVDGKYQMPIIRNDNVIPRDLIGFNYMLTSEVKNIGIHCFVDDYQFERVWNRHSHYLEKLSEYQVVLSPDFSLYLEMPLAMKVWNVYRSRLIGQWWQYNGIRVIPTISWAEKETFEFCFDGIPKGSIVAISTIGVKRDDDSYTIWKDGVDEMIKRIKPSVICVYGGEVEYNYPKDIKVKYYDNKVTERLKKYK